MHNKKGAARNLRSTGTQRVVNDFEASVKLQAEPTPKGRQKFLASLVIVVTAIFCSCVSVQSKSDNDTERVPADISLRFDSGRYTIKKLMTPFSEKAQETDTVEMEGFDLTNSPGDPILPMRIYDVVVPPNIDWHTLQISLSRVEQAPLEGEFILKPAPPYETYRKGQHLTNWGEGKNIVDGKNMKVYANRAIYPAKPVFLIATSQMRKWRFLRIAFVPFQYNPVLKSLNVIKTAYVRISFQRIGKLAFRSDPLLRDSMADEEAKKRFINYKDSLEWYQYLGKQNSNNKSADPDYVIVTTNAIKANSKKLGAFIAHKNSHGHSVLLVTEDDFDTLTGQPPNGRAEKIRKWLIDNYASLGIGSALLIGDPNPNADADDSLSVPMKMFWPFHYWPSDSDFYSVNDLCVPSDYFYADLTGNWDLDGDGVYGEFLSSDNPSTPDPAINPGTYSVRWTGQLYADSNGRYGFMIECLCSGIRMTIDGLSVIDAWGEHRWDKNLGAIQLAVGYHPITIEFQSGAGDALIRLFWQKPSTSYYTSITSNCYQNGGLTGEYFNEMNMEQSSLSLTRLDRSIWFYWGAGDRGASGIDFAQEVTVGRIPLYALNDPYNTLDRILQKIVDYENATSKKWQRNFMTANEYLQGVYSDRYYAEMLRRYSDPLGFITYRIYESDFGLNPPPECSAINPENANPSAPCNLLKEWVHGPGYGIVAISAHGSETQAGVLITSGDQILLDDTKPSFVFLMSCETGYPEYYRNLAYALLTQGALAALSPSRAIWGLFQYQGVSQSRGMGADLGYYYTSNIMQSKMAGDALYDTKAMVNPVPNIFGLPDGAVMMNLMAYNLYGDPTGSLNLGVESRITTPTEGSALRGSTCAIVGRAFAGANATIREVEISADGGVSWAPATDSSGNGTWSTWNYPWALPVVDGTYFLESRATGSTGETEVPKTVRIMVDNTAPTSRIEQPFDSQIIYPGNPVTIEGTSTDNLSGIDRVEISIDNSAWAQVANLSTYGTWSTWSYNWRVPPFVEDHIIHARATDKADNIETIGSGTSVHVSVPPQPPSDLRVLP